ncbi:MAG: succinylglutamate desuccinylase/aspartoacylase family protein [Thermoanaerobaculia bacterium]|nr:succinylglutamate desuccinylase/aspartoacylase family protein [Thermoanaerobaculia bacterium]
MAEPLEIGGRPIARGERLEVEIPVARLFSGDWLSLPVSVIRGEREGPTVWLDAAIHGDELNGMEIIRRVLERLDGREIAGTLLAVPVVNVFGFVHESRYLPDRRDLNRSFPGSQRGSLSARLAHLFLTEVVERCDLGIDLHTGSLHRTNLPQVRGDLEDPRVRSLAEAFQAPLIYPAKPIKGSLRAAAKKRGIPLIVFEGGEPMRFNPGVIAAGEEGVLRVLRHVGLADGAPAPPARPTFEATGSKWVRAGRSGIFRQRVRLGERVERGELLGEIGDAFPGKTRPVKARDAGIVIGHTNKPLVHQGDALVHIGIGVQRAG